MTENKIKVTENKKFKNKDLPRDINHQVWCCVFVSTFMMHITQQDNPFDHNVKVGCAAMQKIWDVVFSDVPYKIIQSSAVYQLVRINFQFMSFENIYITDYAPCFGLVAQHHGIDGDCRRPRLLQRKHGLEEL